MTHHTTTHQCFRPSLACSSLCRPSPSRSKTNSVPAAASRGLFISTRISISNIVRAIYHFPSERGGQCIARRRRVGREMVPSASGQQRRRCACLRYIYGAFSVVHLVLVYRRCCHSQGGGRDEHRVSTLLFKRGWRQLAPVSGLEWRGDSGC